VATVTKNELQELWVLFFWFSIGSSYVLVYLNQSIRGMSTWRLLLGLSNKA